MTPHFERQRKTVMDVYNAVRPRRQSASIDAGSASLAHRECLSSLRSAQVLEGDENRLSAMDGKDSVPSQPLKQSTPVETSLDEAGFNFVRKCISLLERRGLEDQGLYRLVGVSSRVNRLLSHGLDPKKLEKLALDDPLEWENKTVTSALKTYFRNLPEPLMTHRFHAAFLDAARLSSKTQRVMEIAALVRQLPQPHYEMLKLLIQHLVRVASKSHSNLMTVSNLGVCFGPTLFRPEEDTMAAIMDIKFCNMVVEILITHSEKVFSSSPNIPRSPSRGAVACLGTPAIAAAAVVAGAAASAAAIGDVSSIGSEARSSHAVGALVEQAESDSGPVSPDNGISVKNTPSSSASHSSLLSALSLAPVTHTIVTSYSIETPRPVVMESKYGANSGPRKERSSSGLRLSTHTLFEALPPPAASSVSFNAQTRNYKCSSSTVSRRHESPKKSVGVGEEAVSRKFNCYPSMSTSVESLSVTSSSSVTKRQRIPELRSVHEDCLLDSKGNDCDVNSYKTCLYGPASVDSATAAITRDSTLREDSSEARKRLFYRDTTQPQSLLDLRAAGASNSGVPNIMMSKSMEEDPTVVPVSNGASAAVGFDVRGIGAGSDVRVKPPVLGFRPNASLNLLNSSSSSTESLSSRSSKEPSTSPKSRAKLGFPNPPNYRSQQEPFIFRSKLTGGLSSLTPSGAAGSSSSHGAPSTQQVRRVRTIFACVGENEMELSFEPNQIITNVRPSKEPGWLEGTLNGHQGLVPENYVEYLP